jgi:hypothetical protein
VIATGFSDPDKKTQGIESMSRMHDFLNVGQGLHTQPKIELSHHHHHHPVSQPDSMVTSVNQQILEWQQQMQQLMQNLQQVQGPVLGSSPSSNSPQSGAGSVMVTGVTTGVVTGVTTGISAEASFSGSQFLENQAQAQGVQMAQAPQVSLASSQEGVSGVTSSLATAQAHFDEAALAREALIAKAKAFRESQEKKAETLSSLNVGDFHSNLSSHHNSLEVPAFIRKKNMLSETT